MAIKKSELYSSLWASCDELRGGMDASQYKDYVLVMLFIKYVSDKYAGEKYGEIEIPEGASFKDMMALKGKPDIGDQINKKIIAPLANANKLPTADFPDFNDPNKLGNGKEMVERLTNLIAIFENPALDFSKNRAEGDDLLGDAYEFLMRHFATESGKSKGQFYTPAEVSRIMAQVIGIKKSHATSSTTVYDPTCGSGSLLLKVADEAGSQVTLYGQEKDVATAGLARMNMILHSYPTAEIKGGASTLADPKYTDGGSLKTFDYVVANPPFSDKRWTTGFDPNNDQHDRFKGFGVPPAKQGDYAFLLHIVRSLKSNGKGACILPHGVLFRGNAEAEIRKNLIRRGYIKGIIGLPANLFYGTGIPACIVVIDKEDAHNRKGIFMIDASKGFIKDGPKNRLRAQDIHKIVDTFTRQAETPRYSRMVLVEEISDPKNDYNLNLPRYIDSSEPEDLQDINGHLRGGIPESDIDALESYWKVLPTVRASLFKPSIYTGYVDMATNEVKHAILDHPEFEAFRSTIDQLFNQWRAKVELELRGISHETHPKELIGILAEYLLTVFSKAPLLDPYDIYQHLMDYWAETMQDDCYLISADGWVEAAKPRLTIDEKGSKTKEKPDFVAGNKKYKTELLPSELIVDRYFPKDQAIIDQLGSDIAAILQQVEELAEEHGSEGGLLEDAKNDKDKITKASVASRLKEIKNDGDAVEVKRVLTDYLRLSDQDAVASSKLRALQESLMDQVLQQYSKLTEGDIKALIVEDKWLATITNDVYCELERVSQALTSRILLLAERYATPLPQLADELADLAAKVDTHLQKMGAVWK